jgi:hypothetical protein
MRIISIDVGTVSLGLCSYDSSTGNYDFGIYNLRELVKLKKHAKDYTLMAHALIQHKKELFKNADVVLIERQIQAGMKQVATALRAFLWHKKVFLIAPIVVKRHFNTSTSNYAKNKNAACDKFLELASEEAKKRFKPLKKKQKTDVSDAFLQCLYYVQKKSKIKSKS